MHICTCNACLHFGWKWKAKDERTSLMSQRSLTSKWMSRKRTRATLVLAIQFPSRAPKEWRSVRGLPKLKDDSRQKISQHARAHTSKHQGHSHFIERSQFHETLEILAIQNLRAEDRVEVVACIADLHEVEAVSGVVSTKTVVLFGVDDV